MAVLTFSSDFDIISNREWLMTVSDYPTMGISKTEYRVDTQYWCLMVKEGAMNGKRIFRNQSSSIFAGRHI